MSAKALYRLGMAPAEIAGWLREVAKAANQGPIGQAHFVEDVWPALKGGAFKCPNDPPYINEWCCTAGGAFTDMVIDTIFGVSLSLDGISVNSQPASSIPEQNCGACGTATDATPLAVRERGRSSSAALLP